MTLPRQLSLLRNATLSDGSVVDVELIEDVVRGIRPASRSAAVAGGELDTTQLDLTGFMLLTAPAEPHAHLDKALSWDLINPPTGDLVKAIQSWRAYSSEMTVDSIAERALAQSLAMLRNGTTSVRCHVDILTGDQPLRGVEALVRVRKQLAGLMDIELVALAGPDAPDAAIEIGRAHV